MRRPAPWTFLALVAFAPFAPACSSKEDPVAVEDSAADSVLEDISDFEEPVFDSSDPLGRVLVLPLFDPIKRCTLPVTEIGHFDQNPDGTIAECGAVEVCYQRPDGILAYHTQDCVHGSNFRANWTRLVYSDLGPCEPIKRLQFSIKSCPTMSCTFARDVTVDTALGCATAIESKGCRDTFGAPTACFCNGTMAFVAANPKSPTAPPAGYTACDATNDACKKALAMVDTVKGCATSSLDGGIDSSEGG
jgi:hypothetical protein